MKKIPYTLFFLILYFKSFATFDYFWTDKTPNGYQIERFDGGYSEYSNKQGKIILKSSNTGGKWYFYKNFTIGFFGNSTSTCYFISDEKNDKIEFYDDEEVWKNKIEQFKLKPKIWTRWYSDSWSFFPIENSSEGIEFFFYLILLGLFCLIGVVGLCISYFYNFHEKYKSYLWVIFKIFISIGLIYWIFQFLIGTFPKSI